MLKTFDKWWISAFCDNISYKQTVLAVVFSCNSHNLLSRGKHVTNSLAWIENQKWWTLEHWQCIVLSTHLHITHFDPFSSDYKFLFGKYEPSNKPHTTALWYSIIELATHRSCYVFVCKTHLSYFNFIYIKPKCVL